MRTAAERVLELPVLHVPGPQHAAYQPEEPLVTDLLTEDLHQGLVINGPVAIGDIALDEPHGPGPGVAYLPQRGMAPASLPEPVRPGREHRLVNRPKDQADYLADELVPP